MSGYDSTLADRWDSGLAEDPDEAADAREMSAQRRAQALVDAC
jgi:hypothetical protein